MACEIKIEDIYLRPDKIKALRKASGMSLQKLADRTNSSKSYIWELENGRVEPSGLKIFLIANALSVKVEDLYLGNPKQDLTKMIGNAVFDAINQSGHSIILNPENKGE